MTTFDRPDVERACEIWSEYQKMHDVSHLTGKAAGIDPATGQIWFGDDAIDIVTQMDREGAFRPLYFIRVGHDYYDRKGGHR